MSADKLLAGCSRSRVEEGELAGEGLRTTMMVIIRGVDGCHDSATCGTTARMPSSTTATTATSSGSGFEVSKHLFQTINSLGVILADLWGNDALVRGIGLEKESGK